MKTKIVPGILLKVVKPFKVNVSSSTSVICKHCKNKISTDTSVHTLDINEIIEIRYPYEWHFRDIKNNYYQASEEELNKHTKYFGRIDSMVQFGNKHRLDEILIEELYE